MSARKNSSLHLDSNSEADDRWSRPPGQCKEMTLKSVYILLVALSLTIAAAAVHAADLKIGFIDADRINRESAPAERATKKLEKEFAPREQDLRKLEQQIKSLQGQLEKDGLTMSESDRRSREQELGRQA